MSAIGSVGKGLQGVCLEIMVEKRNEGGVPTMWKDRMQGWGEMVVATWNVGKRVPWAMLEDMVQEKGVQVLVLQETGRWEVAPESNDVFEGWVWFVGTDGDVVIGVCKKWATMAKWNV